MALISCVRKVVIFCWKIMSLEFGEQRLNHILLTISNGLLHEVNHTQVFLVVFTKKSKVFLDFSIAIGHKTEDTPKAVRKNRRT